MAEVLNPRPNWQPDRLGDSSNFIVRSVPVFKKDSNSNELNEIVDYRDQAILFGKNSKSFDDLFLDKRFGEVDSKISNPEIKIANIRHELLHPFSVKILQTIFEGVEFKNFSLPVEFLVSAIDIGFFEKTLLLSTTAETLDSSIKRIVATCIANAIIVTDRQFAVSCYNQVDTVMKSNEFQLDGKEQMINYNFIPLNRDLLLNQIYSNIQIFIDNPNENIYNLIKTWNYKLPEKEYILGASKIINTVNNPKVWLRYLLYFKT